jgi:hypothetical protein
MIGAPYAGAPRTVGAYVIGPAIGREVSIGALIAGVALKLVVSGLEAVTVGTVPTIGGR